jgi:T4 RnlA family RNA ligase
MEKRFVIPTYEEAKTIVSTTGELVFYESVQVVDGYKISVFNYRLASYNDFVEYSANELRGLTFVFNEDGSLFNRYVLLHKFFNVNQVAETQFCLIKDEPILAVHDKADGSVVSFVRLPNNNVYAKTKMIVKENDQARMAQAVYDNSESLQRLVNYTLDNDMVAIFELVSPLNRIVLNYTDTDLVLLRLRDNKTGEYLPLETLGEYISDVRIVDDETHLYKTWDDIFTMMETAENKEGCVITLPSGLYKTKTQWYFDLHGLLSDYVYREDYLIEFILDDKIDDIISQIPEEDTEVRSLIDAVTVVVNNYIKRILSEIEYYVQLYYTEFNCDRKAFALAHSKYQYFAIAIKTIDGKDTLDRIKDYIKRKCYRLENSRTFIRTGEIL